LAEILCSKATGGAHENKLFRPLGTIHQVCLHLIFDVGFCIAETLRPEA